MTAVRSLRRRLWRALQEEDVDTAIRAYTATQADYDAWLAEEEHQREEERQREEEARLTKQREKRDAQPAALKKLGSLRFVRSTRQEPRRRSSKQTVLALQTVERPTLPDNNVPLLPEEMNPSDSFVADDFKSPDYPYEEQSTVESKNQNHREKKKKHGLRLAGFRIIKDESSEEEDDDRGVDELCTTPLHEAARLGSGKLVHLFLAHGGQPNVRNGKQRTALHMAAGGLTAEEEGLASARAREMQPKSETELILGQHVGIRAPCMDAQELKDEDEKHPAVGGANKAAMAMRRFLRLGSSSSEKDHEAVEQEKPLPPLDVNRLNKLATQRMDTVLAIMSWCHPEDGSSYAGEGPSINSVDGRGRTALHYAAELGRSDVCMAIVSSFGAILTIVDESSQTPCELAAEHSHHNLAAQLEARALLYTDPYGVDDELMASVLADERDDGNGSHKRLVPPFSWFETLDRDTVRQQRNEITEKATVKMQEILNSRQVQKEANEVMFSYDANDSLDSVTQQDTGNGVDAGLGTFIEDNDQVSTGQTDTVAEDPLEHTSTPQPSNPDESSNRIVNPSAKLGSRESESALDESSNRDENPAVKLNSSDSEYTCMLESMQESHVERFLSFHGWRMEHAMAEFFKDPIKALGDARVDIVMQKSLCKLKAATTRTCLICFDEFVPDAPEWIELRHCEHGFCAECLGGYITDCARSKAGGITVLCPHHECTVPLTQSELRSLAPALWDSLLDAADENFVASSQDLKFCPHPGCTGVVRRLIPSFVAQEGFDHDIIDIAGAVCVAFPEGEADKAAPLTYEGVRDQRYVMSKGSTQPHVAHRFCFACGAENVHWPVPCEKLEQWKAKIREEVADADEGEDGNYQDVAQRLWMKANTRPCPQCKIPIEKNEGCNHMTCSNRHCRYEFCWICRKDWKLHNTETGGFFRCNRWQGEENHEFYDTSPPPHPRPEGHDNEIVEAETQDGYGTAIHSARVAFKKANEMNRFLHHFRRWSAHCESAALERNMANTVCSRLAPVVEAAIDFNGSSDFNFGGKGLSFVHAAFTELLECRSFLQHSYAFAFFRYPTLYYISRNRVIKMRHREKATFEQLQSGLEMLTEQMSDIVARTHLRATQTQIMFLTCEAAEKRRDLSNFLIAILDDERKEQAESENEGNENDAQRRSIPPPIDIGGMLARLHSRAPVGNEHDDMDSDDNGVSYPYPGHRFQRRNLEEEDAAMQEALQASLQAFIAESQSPDTDGYNEEAEGPVAGWSCEACTYMNSRGRTCAMCGTARDHP